MKIATYNVNGVSARLPRLLEWLEATTPDVVCLQEIKTVADNFPTREIKALGYICTVVGQKGFNGVALLSHTPPEAVLDHLPGDASDEQARYIEATVQGIRIVGLYLPNGNPQPGPKFDYKLAWMDRLIAHARTQLAKEHPYILLGDFNVCPTDEDAYDPTALAQDALTQPQSRARYRALLSLGFTDAIRAVQPLGRAYTYWDYQAGAWPKDWGLRIDHILLSPQAADRLEDAGIDRRFRGLERASDHTPVWCRLTIRP